LALSLSVPLAGIACANITGASDHSYTIGEHELIPAYVNAYFNYQQDTNFNNLDEPVTTTFVGSDMMQTDAFAHTFVASNTSTYLDVYGEDDGDAFLNSSGAAYMVWGIGGTQVFFNTDSPAYVTMSVYSIHHGGTGHSNGVLHFGLDSNNWDTRFDVISDPTNFNTTVGAGSHSFYLEAFSEVFSNAGEGGSFTSNNAAGFHLTVSSVPEPASIILLGMGVAAFARKRAR